ncbi:diguanylate cyclase [Clostridium sp. YIM B02555]|uniref:diguanylate cyclase n=1 Tax=Clostridium sp. YIM B02555 TaxID=2911968 RepID=UPI001EEDD460|nr:diguanylate cyclase [Clostridium sp. YIM B02555]
MRTINNKYLIEDELPSEENFSNYIVSHLEKNENYVLCVLKNDFTYEKTRDYLLSKFETIKKLNFENVTNVIKVEIIYGMNGIKLDKPQYGYLMENIRTKIDTQNYIRKCNTREKLNIFMEICSAINTLNMKGYIFDDITLKDIKLIPIPNNNVKIKIKNLLQNELKKFNLINYFPYKYNVDKNNKKSLEKNNTIQVINLFNAIFSEEDFENELRELKYIQTLNNQINIAFDIKYIMNDINNKMKTNYSFFVKDALNTINTNLDLIGMEEEIKIIEKNLQRVLMRKENNKIISFNGEDGSGKSRFLREIKYRIENKYFIDAIYIENINNSSISKEELYNNLLNNLLSKSDTTLKDKYEVYIKKFISILSETETTNKENRQTLQLINRIGRFIYEYTMTKPLIVLIDDLDQKDDVFKLLIRYITLLENNLQNVIILFSMNESRSDKKFLDYIKELRELGEYEEYKINYFNQYDTTKMIKGMLNTNQEFSKLETKVYSETLGNPQYISGVIKELYDNHNLYFDETLGRWEINVSVNDILIPKYLEQKLEENISILNEAEIDILKKLSIFENPLCEKIILENIITEQNQINIYRFLKFKRFFIDKISDQGILVGFSNNLLRNILYLKLEEDQKIEMHKNASVFLEKILFNTDYYIEELLIHLERSNNFEKAYFYAVKYAKALEVSGDHLKAISYYKKILKYPNSINNTKIAINIAMLYEKNSDHIKSFEYLDKANQFAIENDEMEDQIYTLLEMIIIKINNITDMDTSIDYSLKCIRRLLNLKFYAKGEVYYYFALALKYRLENNTLKVVSNVEKALFICKENKIKEDVYGWITLTLVTVKIREGDFAKAKEICIQANEIFIYNSNINGQLYSKLYYTTICKEEGYPNEEVFKQYLEISKLSNKFKSYKKEILSLIYISEIYAEEKKYEQAEEYLLKALRREREEEIYSYSFSICNRLCLVYIKSGKINLAVKYYRLTRQMQKGLKLLGEDIIRANYTYALYNSMICNYDASYKYLKEIYKQICNLKNQQNKVMICECYEIMLYKCKNERSIKFLYEKLNDKINNLGNSELEIEIRVRTIKRIFSLGYIEFAKKLFFEIDNYPKDYNIEGLYIFLELNFKNKNFYNYLINKGLRICSYINNEEIKADLFSVIGEKYNELNCYLLAMNYYYEAITGYINSINSLPKSDKLSYINKSNFLKTRRLFLECLNMNLGLKNKFKEFKEVNKGKAAVEILNELEISNILSNEAVFKLAEELYEKSYYNDLNDVFKVFQQFSSDTISNIKNVLKYMARVTLADKAMIVTENNENMNNVICTYRVNEEDEINRYISVNIDSEDDIFIISNNDIKLYQFDNEILKSRIKAFLYMKIRNTEKHINSNSEINARLILTTNNAINNINPRSVEIIQELKPFLIYLLEKHNLTITSTLDKLTGTYNRKYFEEALIFLLEDARSEKSELAVIMFDIDDFKGINDKYGHQTGDEVLIKLIKEVKKCMDKKDVIGRYGGEEFILLLPNVNKEKAISIAEKIRNTVEVAKILGDKRNVTISIGIAMSANEDINCEEIIERADQALYQAKHEGKNRVILWKKNYGVKNNINNELTGVMSGNAAKDYHLAVILKDIANIVKVKEDKEVKINKFISKVMEIIECDSATVFCINHNKITNMYSKSRNDENVDADEKFNFKLIYKVIEDGNGVFLIDWVNMDNYTYHGIPDWKSVCVVPVICNGEILSVIYLSVSVNKKEFSCSDYNLLTFLSEVGVSIF